MALLVAGGILAIALHSRYRFMQMIYIGFTIAGCLLGVFSLILLLQGRECSSLVLSWLGIFSFSFSVDSLSIFFLLPIFIIQPLAALYSRHYLEDPEKSLRVGVHYFLFNILAISMVLLIMARDFLSFALCWEIMSLSSFFLVLYDHENRECRRAGYIYLLFAQTGAFFIFAAFGLLFYATGSLTFDGASAASQSIRITVFFLAMVGFASKAGVFPLHIWLPHAHPAAPAHVSAMLSGVMIKMGIYGILRLYFVLDEPNLIFGQALLILGIVSGLLGVLHALGQKDLKGLLAYSSIENIGIILIGAGLALLALASGSPVMAVLAFSGTLLHVFNHALFKPLLFMGAGAVQHQAGLRSIDQMGGLIKNMPVTGKTFFAGSVAISGLPPMNGFVGEFLIYLAAFTGLGQGSSLMLSSAAAIMGLAFIGGLGLACFTRAAGIAFQGEARTAQAGEAKECGRSMQEAMIALSLACLLIGVWPEPFIQLALFGMRDILPQLAGQLPINLAYYLGMASRILLALVLVVLFVRHLLYRGKTISKSSTWGCGFTRASSRLQYTGPSFARSMLDFHRPFVRVHTKYSGIGANEVFPKMTRYETEVEDMAEFALIKYLVLPIRWVAERLHWIQQGRVQLYIAYIVFVMILLLLLV
ncbi:hydrogenase [Desulfococcaceae bacterium OttesenSCG-928-F15]|nr:hydrogenase [Desulfococcaceae bacterium OttesenSCG-928-F15]